MSGLNDLKNVASKAMEAAGEAVDKAREIAESEQVQEAVAKAKEKGEEAVAKAKEIAESEQVQNAISAAKEKGSEALDVAKRAKEEAEIKLEEAMVCDLNGDGGVGRQSVEEPTEFSIEIETEVTTSAKDDAEE